MLDLTVTFSQKHISVIHRTENEADPRYFS